jgi:hypothetical protein
MASRLAWFLGLMLTSVASTLASPPQTTAGLLRLLTIMFATQVAALLVLASVYARAAERLRLAASAVDVF